MFTIYKVDGRHQREHRPGSYTGDSWKSVERVLVSALRFALGGGSVEWPLTTKLGLGPAMVEDLKNDGLEVQVTPIIVVHGSYIHVMELAGSGARSPYKSW